MSDRVVVLANLRVAKDKLEAFEPAWAKFVKGVWAEPNCVHYNIAVSPDKLEYQIYEEYKGKGLDEHEAAEHFTSFNALAVKEGFWATSPVVHKNFTAYE